MATPVETIADALIAFIMSLLHDPDAEADFLADPEGALAGAGLSDVCDADVDTVRPIIIDHPHVVPNPKPHPDHGHDHGPASEIVRMIQQFTTVDARSTIVDQSVNQNIWTEGGDVTQVFDQEAVIASGDDAIAAGDDATTVDADTDIRTGDISAGNTSNDDSFNDVGGSNEDSFNDDSFNGTGDAADAANADEAAAPEADAPVDEAAASDATVSDAPVQTPASLPEPADLLESDLTAGGGESYDADAASSAVNDDALLQDPLEDD